jgi:hypothetical protein
MEEINMATSLTLREFENINAYSNRNLEKVIASTVNTSSNAVFVSMFEDSVILLDHDEGIFYMAEYEFDPNNLVVSFDSFQQIELVREENDFRQDILEFFEDEDVSADDLSESYKEIVMKQDKYINDLISDAMMTKDLGSVDYSKVKNAVEEVGVSIVNEDYYRFYKERLNTHPLTEIKYFNWEDAVKVSLVETEEFAVVNESAVERAKDLWKNVDFKDRFIEACETFVEDVEEGTELFKLIFEDYPQVYFLDGADRKTLFGKAIISSKELRENTNDLLKGLSLLFENFDLAELRETYLAEAEIEADVEDEDDLDAEVEVKVDKEKKEKPKELSPEQLQKIADELKKITEKIEDVEVKEKLDDLIQKLEKGKEEGTRPEVVKESIALLSL